MLRASRELLKPGGRIVFATIFIRPGVDERAYRRATRSRGRGLASRSTPAELLRAAGFVDVRESDVTPAFARTTRAFLETGERLHDKLAHEWGEDALAQNLRNWRKTIAVTEEGILCRGIFSGRRPAR